MREVVADSQDPNEGSTPSRSTGYSRARGPGTIILPCALNGLELFKFPFAIESCHPGCDNASSESWCERGWGLFLICFIYFKSGGWQCSLCNPFGKDGEGFVSQARKECLMMDRGPADLTCLTYRTHFPHPYLVGKYPNRTSSKLIVSSAYLMRTLSVVLVF